MKEVREWIQGSGVKTEVMSGKEGGKYLLAVGTPGGAGKGMVAS